MKTSSAGPKAKSVSSSGGLATRSKVFELALGEQLDHLEYGAYSDFADAYGVSHTWVGRMRDPADTIHVRASDIGRACQAVGSVQPINAALRRWRIGGHLHHVVPLPEVSTSVDLVMDGVTASAQISKAVATLVQALADNRIDGAEKAAIEAALVETHEQILALLAGVRGAR